MDHAQYQATPVHTLTPHCFKIHRNIVLQMVYLFHISTMQAAFPAHLSSEKSTNYDSPPTSCHSLLIIHLRILFSNTHNPAFPLSRRIVIRDEVQHPQKAAGDQNW
jgi:hypothetical protein